MSISVFYIIKGIFNALELALLGRVLLSWIPHDAYHPVLSIVYSVTDPLLKPFRGLIPLGGIDLSPILAFLVLGIVERVIFRLLGVY